MAEFVQIKLDDMLNQLGENEVKSILSSFMCDDNFDVQDFIRNKAIEFSRQGLAKTTLVYWKSDDGEEKYLIGYYAIAPKFIRVSRDAVSKTMAKKLNNHGSYDVDTREYIVPAPLIAQLSKNYSEGNDTLIYGCELLQMAVDKIKEIQNEIGGRFIFLESEDREKLIDFYKNNGFTAFEKRKKDKNETSTEYLIRWLRYLK